MDLDGTLVRRNGAISLFTTKVIKDAYQQGFIIMIATGRTYEMAKSSISFPFHAIACMNGAMTYNEGVLVDEVEFTYDNLHLMTDFFNSKKMHSVDFIANLYEIDRSEIVAFGDADNDMEMIKNCGLGIAVKNAIPKLIEVADYVCLSNRKDGVARYIKENLLKR